jgi:hypothetical protein
MADLKTSDLTDLEVISGSDLVLISKDNGGSYESRKSDANAFIRHSNQRIITTASPSAILVTDGFLLFDTTSNAISISLPAASVGKVQIPFKDSGANSAINTITFNRVGSDTIVDSAIGQTSTIIGSNGFSGSFISNGTDTWYLTGA